MPGNHNRRQSKVRATLALSKAASPTPRGSHSSPTIRPSPRFQIGRHIQSSPTCSQPGYRMRPSSPSSFVSLLSHATSHSNPASESPTRRTCEEDEDEQLVQHKSKRPRISNDENQLQSERDKSGQEDDSLDSDDEDTSFKGAWFVTPARCFGRLYEMWIPMYEILEAGKLDNPQLVEEDHSKKTWRQILLHRELVAIIPKLYTRAKACGLSTAQLSKLLEKKRSDARNEDVQRIKDGAQCLRPISLAFFPALIINDKVKRGFYHPQLGRYICPINWLDKYDKEPSFRQKCLDGKVRPTPNDLPMLLFDEDTFDMDDLFASFLRNIMLIHAWRMLFIGPKAAFDGVAAPRQSGRGNAAKNNIKHMTVGTLAYVATVVYYSLRSDSTFHAGGGEHFDYSEFYRGIVTTLTKDASDEQLKELLLWWDRKVFPNYADEEDDAQEEADNVFTGFCGSGRGLLKAQLRRKTLGDNTNIN